MGLRIAVALGVLAWTGAARADAPLPPGVVHPTLQFKAKAP
jgi:hypothetical protein